MEKRLRLLLLLLLALPIGMLAQGSTWQAATLINNGSSGSGTLDKNNTDAWFKIEVPEEGRVQLTATPDGTLNIQYVDLCWNDNNVMRARKTINPGKSATTLDLTDAGKGTYYVLVHRWDGAGSFSLSYKFTACSYANDAENNDTEGTGSMLSSGKPVQGRLGYLDGKDYRDNSDWYKLEVPQDGTVKLTIAPSQENELNIQYVDFVRYDKNNKTYYARKTLNPGKETKTLTITDAGVGTYYVHVHRWDGHGGYSLRYDFVANTYANDAENNDTEGKGSKLINGETVEGHLGYLDASDYRDNADWYKLEVPQDGTVKLTINPNQENELNIQYVDFVRYDKNNNTYYARKTLNPGKETKTLTITDAGVGTYYVHVHRWDGHGGYTLRYDFVANTYANDAEPNDNNGEGSMLVNGETVEGHLGYLDASDYRDNADWYKLEVPKEGTVRLIIDPNQENKLNIQYVDFVRYDSNNKSYYARKTAHPGNNRDTLIVTDAGTGTYYVHVHRWDGHGGYKLRYDFFANTYGNDEEPNDEAGSGGMIEIGQTIQGRLGYLDGKDYRDNADWYKLEVPKEGTVRLIIDPNQDNKLNIQYVDFVRLDKGNKSYYARKTAHPGNKRDTLIVEDAGIGTYYVHVHRWDGHGGYTMKYELIPNSYRNDIEPNDKLEQATETIGIDETITAHLGYLDADDYRDKDDWFKIETKNTTTFLTINYEKDSLSTLNVQYIDIVKKVGDQTSVVYTARPGLKSNEIIEVMSVEENAEYYANVHRWDGHGGYSLTCGALERAADSKIRISFIGRDKVRLGVPTDYTIKIENLDSHPSTKFFLLVHATDDIKLLGCKLPGKNGVEELPMDSISYDGDPAMVFVVPSMAPYETYSFNIMAEGLVIKDAREFVMDTSNPRPQTNRIVISGTTCLIVAGLVALDYAGDKVTEFMTDVIHDHIDLDEKELAYYREKVNKKVDWGLVEEKTKTGETVVVARRAVKTVATKWLETVPGGGLINFAGELLETTKAFSGAIVRRWLWFTTKDTDAKYKEWEKKYNEKLLDAKQGINGVVRSFDPNEMVGPVGYGDENYISEAKTMDYKILFENKKEATAPAYRIRISDELDENVFDLSTVRFGSTSHEGIGYNWKMNREGNKLTWDIEGIELPPNVNAPEGEGYVTFSVDLKPGLKNGTQIKNKASIRFDYNEVIETNEYVNTLDLVAPTTKMKSVAKQDDGKFLVTCEGIDSESGVSHYQFYISKDGEGYVFLGNNTEPSLSFEMDQTNANYSIIAYAVDNVGNTQNSAPEALVFNPTGIRTVNVIADDQWTINRLNGTSVAKGKGVPDLNLPAGVYIIRQGNNVRKVIIK